MADSIAHTDNHVAHAYVIITTLCNHTEEKKRGTNKSIGIQGKEKTSFKKQTKKTGADCYILRTGPS